MVGYLIGVAVGAILTWGCWTSFFEKMRARHRMVRTTGVIVGRRNVTTPGQSSPASVSRAAIFSFTTLDGRTVEAESDVTTFPGPKPGKRVNVIYDPHKPRGAEIVGRAMLIRVIEPIFGTGGIVLLVFSLIKLLTH